MINLPFTPSKRVHIFNCVKLVSLIPWVFLFFSESCPNMRCPKRLNKNPCIPGRCSLPAAPAQYKMIPLLHPCEEALPGAQLNIFPAQLCAIIPS